MSVTLSSCLQSLGAAESVPAELVRRRREATERLSRVKEAQCRLDRAQQSFLGLNAIQEFNADADGHSSSHPSGSLISTEGSLESSASSLQRVAPSEAAGASMELVEGLLQQANILCADLETSWKGLSTGSQNGKDSQQESKFAAEKEEAARAALQSEMKDLERLEREVCCCNLPGSHSSFGALHLTHLHWIGEPGTPITPRLTYDRSSSHMTK